MMTLKEVEVAPVVFIIDDDPYVRESLTALGRLAMSASPAGSRN